MYKIKKYGDNYVIDERYREGWMISYSYKSYGEYISLELAKLTSIDGHRYNNLIVRHKDYAIIKIFDKKSCSIYDVKIDIDLVNKVSQVHWYLDHKKSGTYVRGGKDKIYLHRYIMNVSKNNQVDHMNCDTMDNRTSNLRVCSAHTNSKNRKNTTSKYGKVGIHFDGDRYIASINIDKYKNKRKSFSISKFGKKEALSRAIQCREDWDIKYGYYDVNVRKLFK